MTQNCFSQNDRLKQEFSFDYKMSVESEKSKSSASIASGSSSSLERHRKAILKRSGGVESELTKDDLFERMERFNPDWMDSTKTVVFPVMPHPKYEGKFFPF